MSKRNRVVVQDEDLLEPSTHEPAAPRRRRRWPWIVGGTCCVLFVLVALAPTVVSQTSLGPRLVASAAQGSLDGSLEVRAVSVGWLSPTALRGITVRDKEAQTIGTVESVVVGKSLLNLIRSQSDLGTIVIEKPQLTVVARANGSNLEDLVAPLLNQPSSGGETPAVVIEVRDGAIKLVDAATEQSWQITPLAAHVESPRGAEKSWKIDVEAKTGDAVVTANIVQTLGEHVATQAALQADQFPLAPLQPILTRLLGPTGIAGTFTGKVEADMADGGGQLRASLTNVDIADLAFASPKLLGEDVLRLSQVKANGVAQLNKGVWQLRDLEVQSEVAALIGSGDVRVSDFTSGQSIPQIDCDIQGVVDLARLMQLLPHTLRAREGVQLTSGQARLALTSQAVQGGRRFAATLGAEQVEATSGGRTIALAEPVNVTAAVVQTPRGWQIEKVDAKSSFLTAAAAGTLAKGNVTLQGDLSKLAAELDQFVDLGDIRLAGQLGGSGQWQETAGKLSASGQFNFRSFELAMPGVMPWRENDLVVTLQARGIDAATYGVAGGKVSVLSGADELDLTLEQGADGDPSKPLPVDVRLTGNLATWLPRMQAFVPLAGWQVSGPVTITAKGTASAAEIQIADAQFDLKQLQVAGHGLHISEPQLNGRLKGSYDVGRGATSISSATVQGQSLAANIENLLVRTDHDAKITGGIAVRGDVGRLMSWLSDPSVPATSQLAGSAEAEATFTVIGGSTKANLKGQITDLAYLTRTPAPVAGAGRPAVREVAAGSPWQTAWSEPLVTFGGDASYDLAKDAITLDKMQAAMGTSGVVASGTVSQLASKCQLDLTGEVRYDLATWTPKIQPLLGPTFDMTGNGTKPFELHGPLWEKVSPGAPGDAPLLPLALTGKAGLGWQGAQWMALEVGPAELAAELKDSTIFVQPTKIPLSQGTLQLSPALSLQGSNWLVTQSQSRVIDHVVITPQMCDTWIKFVFPPLAGATESQGKFSVDVDNAAVPLQAPTGLDAKGKFVVHNVSVGPGPLARSLISAVSQVKAFTDGKVGIEGLAGLAGSYLAPGASPTAPEATGRQWIELPEQEVPVTVAQGRVYHEGLTLKTKEFTLRSTGSVGIADQSIQLLCEVPIRDEWLKDPKLAGLKGQTLKIPVKGTISDPKPDVSAAFGGLVGLGTAGIKGAIGSQIDKGLQGGTSAAQGEIGKVQNKVQGELEKGKQKVEDELRKGLKGLFK